MFCRHLKQSGAVIGVVGCCFLCFAMAATGAEITRSDGSIVRGEIVSEDDAKVVINVSRLGMTSKVSILKSEIAEINRTAGGGKPAAVPAATSAPSTIAPAPGGASSGAAPKKGEPTPPPIVKNAGPVYYVIPLRGTVGVTMVSSILDKSLADAVARKPSVVILDIDSGGGMIQEVEKLIEVISKYKKQVRIVVYTKQALSAAAITALSVDEIYVQSGATFGAATAWRMTPDGTPEAVAEKMASIWRARGRSAAELGNHSPLLAEAMIEADRPLYLAMENGKPVILAEKTPGSTLLKAPRRLLTLTAREAVACGLAKAVVESPAELGKLLGFEGWKECQGVGVEMAHWWAKCVEAADKDWKTSLARLDEAFRAARVADPSSYNDYQQNDMESVRKWNERTNKCVASLRVAENNMLTMAKMADEFPHLGADREGIDDARRHIAEMRVKIEASKVRVIRR